MSKLTKEECKVAADRARAYPPGYGYSFVARDVTNDELTEEGYDDIYDVVDHPLSGPITASWWFEKHPEDIALG